MNQYMSVQRSVNYTAILIAATLGIAAPASAQDQADSATVYAKRAGIEAANRTHVGASFSGALGGAAFGILGFTLLTDADAGPKIGAVAGLSLVITTVQRAPASSRVAADSAARSLVDCDSSYRATFARSYAQRLGERRQKAIVASALTAAGIGFAAFLGLLGGI